MTAQSPWQFGRNPLSLLGLQTEVLPASSGPLGGTEALLEFTSEAQGGIPWKSHRLAIQIKQSGTENICLTLPSEK